ncbi:Hypothetical predicted protein, partial [Pelobates cultripes]
LVHIDAAFALKCMMIGYERMEFVKPLLLLVETTRFAMSQCHNPHRVPKYCTIVIHKIYK